MGLGLAAIAALFGLSYTLGRLRLFQLTLPQSKQPPAVCQTITTDPDPPLKVRSSPVVAPDNVVGTLRNGTMLTIIDENSGWLRVSQPVAGWVYKELTVTSCVPAEQAVETPIVASNQLLAMATEQYHTGNLNAAIALAKTVPSEHPDFAAAQRVLLQWPSDWNRAENEFYTVQKAVREQRWNTVLQRVPQFPDNRFWKARLAPLVQQAIQRQAQPPAVAPVTQPSAPPSSPRSLNP